MKNFILGFLVSTTLFLLAFTSYILFCPHAKTLQHKPDVILMLPPPGQLNNMLPFPKG